MNLNKENKKINKDSDIYKDSALFFMNNNFYEDIEKYVNYKKKSTGFQLLDDNLGGLMPSLYLIGAASSLGKTTFILQIADNIASKGNDVLYFSLEQSKFELISKSLSRVAWSEFEEKVSTKHIMYNTDRDITFQSSESYKESISKNMYIHEGNFGTTVKQIRDKVYKHIEQTNNKPVIIIDYLQVIRSESNMSDKAMIDSIVTELKRMSRDLFIPIFVISSLNRANYLNPMSYESFKESGSIEYTADVLLGLQYKAVNEISLLSEKKLSDKRALMKKAIEGDSDDYYRRDIELIALKNRNGKQRFNVSFSYYPIMNYFFEKEEDIFSDLL